MTLAPVWIPGQLCPCDCGTPGSKLRARPDAAGVFHITTCACRSCLGKRNRAKGRTAQRRAHQRLGGTGFSPLHEEAGRTYDLTVQVEAKAGSQVPRAFTKFITEEWTRRAFSQATRAIPMGVSAFPALYLEPPGGGAWLMVEVAPRARGRAA